MWIYKGFQAVTLIQLMLVVSLVLASACSTTRTASGDIANTSHTLELKAGDEVRVITIGRERFKMLITNVSRQGLNGEALKWKASKVAPGQEVHVLYDELAFIQLDRSSPAKTAGLIATVTLVGALVAAVAAVPPVVVIP